MKIDQKKLDETWDLFIKHIKNNISNVNNEALIQVRNMLQKEINEKGYADTDDPKLAEQWLNKRKEKEILAAGKAIMNSIKSAKEFEKEVKK